MRRSTALPSGSWQCLSCKSDRDAGQRGCGLVRTVVREMISTSSVHAWPEEVRADGAAPSSRSTRSSSVVTTPTVSKTIMSGRTRESKPAGRPRVVYLFSSPQSRKGELLLWAVSRRAMTPLPLSSDLLVELRCDE